MTLNSLTTTTLELKVIWAENESINIIGDVEVIYSQVSKANTSSEYSCFSDISDSKANITKEIAFKESVGTIHNLQPGTSYCVIVKGKYKDDHFTSEPQMFTTIHGSKYK